MIVKPVASNAIVIILDDKTELYLHTSSNLLKDNLTITVKGNNRLVVETYNIDNLKWEPALYQETIRISKEN